MVSRKLFARALAAMTLAGLVVAAGAASAGAPAAADIALQYLKAHKQELGLTGSDLNDVVSTEVVSAHTGVTHVYLQQRHKGIDVHTGLTTVNVLRNGTVLSAGNRFVSNLAAAAGGQGAQRSALQAAGIAAKHVDLKPSGLSVVSSGKGEKAETKLSSAGIARDGISARLVWQPVTDGVRLAWNITWTTPSRLNMYAINVDAQTGDVLESDDWVVHENAEATAAAVAPSAESAAALLPNEPVNDGSSYRVFPLPFESPSDGPSSIVQNPADALASPWGWHDTNGAAGAEFTVTRGNNAYAYADVDNNNLPDPGSAPEGGAGLDFDFAADFTKQPDTYLPAAVTNLFYWNNLAHDLNYRYGFTEAFANFQANNYGRGGLPGADFVLAEAQDGSGKNNANFGTSFPDGSQSAVMQMFRWRSSVPNPVTVHAPSPIAGTYGAPMAGFGQSLAESGPRIGTVAYIDDGVAAPGGGTVNDGCEPFTLPAGVEIPMVDRGLCTFVVKVKNAQDAGAISAIVVQNNATPPTAMGGADPTITIPSVMISQADGALFKANDPLEATIADGTGGVPERDSDFDNGVIAHEYMHGVSNRLTGGPTKTFGCLSSTTVLEHMGEGWSDLLALFMTSSPADRGATPRGTGAYVSFQPADGLGIRPTQYSTDMSINPSTYDSTKDVATISQPHGVGYVWATMAWEVYWNLVDKYGYNANLYDSWDTGGNNLWWQLVMDGMKLQPCRPGMVDGRNAILAADVALTGGENQCEIWRGFAKRGLGFSANQGSSLSRTDGTQAFDLPATCTSAAFGAFSEPVAGPPAINEANAGSTVPVKFQLTGGGDSPQIDSQEVDCTTLVATGGAPSPLDSPGGAGLKRDGTEYRLNWKTDGSWAGTCRRVTLRIAAAQNATAYFRFT
jgi:extracellular elastinolytic metalloproteinase